MKKATRADGLNQRRPRRAASRFARSPTPTARTEFPGCPRARSLALHLGLLRIVRSGAARREMMRPVDLQPTGDGRAARRESARTSTAARLLGLSKSSKSIPAGSVAPCSEGRIHKGQNTKNPSRTICPRRIPTIQMAPRVGFEPTTLRLTAGCSAVELPRNLPINCALSERAR